MIVKSSHQNLAAEIRLATNRAMTATVARTTATILPTHTFHALLTLGGGGPMEAVSFQLTRPARNNALGGGITMSLYKHARPPLSVMGTVV